MLSNVAAINNIFSLLFVRGAEGPPMDPKELRKIQIDIRRNIAPDKVQYKPLVLRIRTSD